MIYLIAGMSHTGKTVLAQRLLEQIHVPYLSLDHLKMGLIRSKMTSLTPMDDDRMTDFLFPIAAEIIKTAIENGQSMIVEGCYIPANWQDAFTETYLPHIRSVCLAMSERYITGQFGDIVSHANDIEQRLDDSGLSAQWLIEENQATAAAWQAAGLPLVMIDGDYAAAADEAIRLLMQ